MVRPGRAGAGLGIWGPDRRRKLRLSAETGACSTYPQGREFGSVGAFAELQGYRYSSSEANVSSTSSGLLPALALAFTFD